ncbi:hypothetical protein PFISCL1PPCAC_1568, partial [Pristionchus fissidentatus]
HPAVLQHLLQQQQLQQLAMLQAAQSGMSGGLGTNVSSSLGLPVYAGAPLMQQPAALAALQQLPLAARSESASTSTSSSVENSVPSSSTHRPPSSSSPSGESVEAVRLHIANIPYKWRDTDLEKMFKEHGEVSGCEIIFNERGSKGFGFVTMTTREGAETARAAINGRVFEGRVVEVNAATAKMSGRSKAKVLHNQQQQQAAMQQLLMAHQVLAQYAAQQQLQQQLQMQGLAPLQQAWMQQQPAA